MDPDDVSGVRSVETDIRHDRDDHVLLLVESPRVEAPGVAKGGELPCGQDSFHKLTRREGENLNDVGIDRNTGLTDTEELVDERSKSS